MCMCVPVYALETATTPFGLIASAWYKTVSQFSPDKKQQCLYREWIQRSVCRGIPPLQSSDVRPLISPRLGVDPFSMLVTRSLCNQ
ncbi:unnamed protein product [Knipowitschia caucasica]|uniref:Secreted protein n=1 Tax=Knipowitschia caucasica TaxID=637954 RepID=A0AAV2KEB4_KNICA